MWCVSVYYHLHFLVALSVSITQTPFFWLYILKCIANVWDLFRFVYVFWEICFHGFLCSNEHIQTSSIKTQADRLVRFRDSLSDWVTLVKMLTAGIVIWSKYLVCWVAGQSIVLRTCLSFSSSLEEKKIIWSFKLSHHI